MIFHKDSVDDSCVLREAVLQSYVKCIDRSGATFVKIECGLVPSSCVRPMAVGVRSARPAYDGKSLPCPAARAFGSVRTLDAHAASFKSRRPRVPRVFVKGPTCANSTMLACYMLGLFASDNVDPQQPLVHVHLVGASSRSTSPVRN